MWDSKKESNRIRQTVSIVVICIGVLTIGSPGTEAQAGLPIPCVEEKLIEASANIVIARIIEIGRSPGYSSGYVLASQRVKYAIDSRIRGNIREKIIVVPHLLAKGKESTNENGTALNSRYFVEGSELILFLNASAKKTRFNEDPKLWPSYEYPSDDCFLLASKENISLIRAFTHY